MPIFGKLSCTMLQDSRSWKSFNFKLIEFKKARHWKTWSVIGYRALVWFGIAKRYLLKNVLHYHVHCLPTSYASWDTWMCSSFEEWLYQVHRICIFVLELLRWRWYVILSSSEHSKHRLQQPTLMKVACRPVPVATSKSSSPAPSLAKFSRTNSPIGTRLCLCIASCRPTEEMNCILSLFKMQHLTDHITENTIDSCACLC